MPIPQRPRPNLALLLLLTAGCSAPLDGETQDVARVSQRLSQSVTYVGKQTITNFTGYGQHLQYWPLFGRTSPQTARRTDDDGCIELTPAFESFKHHYLPEGRTFSNDALGSPIGTKTRGGYPSWPTFTLPDGTTGRSGTFYDESNVGNSNNTVNELKIDSKSLSRFCLNLVTDNSAGENNPDARLEARSDNVNRHVDPNDLTFDGQPDMYTFRYEGMGKGDVVKIRMQCTSSKGCKGAGLGGIMVSDISTCTGGDAGAPDGGPDVPDGGAQGVDKGAAGADGAATAPADGGTQEEEASPGTAQAGGCGCRTIPSPARSASATVSLLVAAAALARRARSRRREARGISTGGRVRDTTAP